MNMTGINMISFYCSACGRVFLAEQLVQVSVLTSSGELHAVICKDCERLVNAIEASEKYNQN